MITYFEAEADGVDAHDSIFTRGYYCGYVQAMIERQAGFVQTVLESQVESLVRTLECSGARVEVGEPERRLYGVRWCRLEARFP